MPAHKNRSRIDNDLHRLILDAVPPDARGDKTIVNAARTLGVSRMAVWKWLKNNRLTPNRAAQIVAMSEGRVSLKDLHRFVYGS